jgi:hypothetical protein
MDHQRRSRNGFRLTWIAIALSLLQYAKIASGVMQMTQEAFFFAPRLPFSLHVFLAAALIVSGSRAGPNFVKTATLSQQIKHIPPLCRLMVHLI